MDIRHLTTGEQRHLDAALNKSEINLLFDIANTLNGGGSSTSTELTVSEQSLLEGFSHYPATFYKLLIYEEGIEKPDRPMPDSDHITDVEYVDPDASSPITPTEQTPPPKQEPVRLLLPPGLEKARDLIRTCQAHLYQLLCDPTTQKPTEWAMDAATGQVKDLIAAAVTILMSSYCTEVALAIPVAVLLLKKGLSTFCAVSITA
jgi:hypothetical protein